MGKPQHVCGETGYTTEDNCPACQDQARQDEPAPDTDAIADDITGELVTICATRADLDAAERIITRTSYL